MPPKTPNALLHGALDALILKTLAHGPLHGYAIARFIEETTGEALLVEEGSLYPALYRMERRGWLKSRKEPSPVGPERRVYHRTAAGGRELVAWLKSPPAMGAERFAYLGQLIFMGELDDLEQTTAFLRQLQERLAGTLEFLEQVTAPLERRFSHDPKGLSAVEFHELLALRMGVHSLRAKVGWCAESLDLIHTRQARRRKNA